MNSAPFIFSHPLYPKIILINQGQQEFHILAKMSTPKQCKDINRTNPQNGGHLDLFGCVDYQNKHLSAPGHDYMFSKCKD